MILQEAWCRETSADPENWSEDNPALGQCAVTALIVQDYLGGGIVRAETWNDWVGVCGSHYWNVLENGLEIDLTRQQFDDSVKLINMEARSRDYLLSHPATKQRYELLLERVRSE